MTFLHNNNFCSPEILLKIKILNFFCFILSSSKTVCWHYKHEISICFDKKHTFSKLFMMYNTIIVDWVSFCSNTIIYSKKKTTVLYLWCLSKMVCLPFPIVRALSTTNNLFLLTRICITLQWIKNSSLLLVSLVVFWRLLYIHLQIEFFNN